jgi:hypothetical protein
LIDYISTKSSQETIDALVDKQVPTKPNMWQSAKQIALTKEIDLKINHI